MLRRWSLGASLVIGMLAATAGPAAAGGWWSFIQLDDDHLVIGHEVRARTEFLFISLPEAERARQGGAYHAYLLRNYDDSALDRAMTVAEPGDWWSLGDAEAIRLGPVALSGWDGNLVQASAAFEVPDLEPGRYALMFCTSGCAQPLGDVVPASATLVADPATARLAGRLDRLDERAHELEQTLQTERFNSNYAKRTALDATSAVRHLRTEIEDVRAVVDGLEPVPAGNVWDSLGWLLGGAALAAMVAVGLAGRRRRRGHGREAPSVQAFAIEPAPGEPAVTPPEREPALSR